MTATLLRLAFATCGIYLVSLGLRLLLNKTFLDKFSKMPTTFFDELLFTPRSARFYNRYIRGLSALAVGLLLIYLAFT